MNTKGYCEHGLYVGGCGIDWICPYCEDGISMKELLRMKKQEARRRTIRRSIDELLRVLIILPFAKLGNLLPFLRFITRPVILYVFTIRRW